MSASETRVSGLSSEPVPPPTRGAPREPFRAVGLDLGTVRIGVAASDAGGVLASPRTTVRRTGDRAGDHRRLAALVVEEGADVVVVGLPLSLDGSVGRAARLVLAELDELTAALGVPVVTHDERFTTATAHQRLAAGGRRTRARRDVVDQSAAAVLLQAWLDGRGRRTATPADPLSPVPTEERS